jgi:capsular exopolysaccharide synthesis family protein
MSDSPSAHHSQPVGRSALATYVAILKRRRWVALLGFVLPILAAIAFTATQEAEYSGSANVVLNRQSLANALTNTPDPTAQANDYIRIVQTQAELARSPSVATRSLANTGVRMTPRRFLQISSVKPGRDSDVLVFTVTHGNRDTARILANSYARGYVQFRLAVDTTALKEAGGEVRSRINQLQNSPGDNSRIIASLQSREQELETLEALQTAKATIVYDTEPPAQTAPTLKRNLALGIVAGLLLAAALAALLEATDTRIRYPEEIGEHLGVTGLGGLSAPPSNADGRPVMLSDPASADAEAFRLLQTNLRFAMLDSTVKSLMVTSSKQGEGKSTTIANLAVALARSGRRVVLVDLDLRRPAIRRIFRMPGGPGLTDVLLGTVDLDAVTVEVDLDQAEASGTVGGSLRVIPAGTPPPNPGELIGPAGGVARLLAELEADADIVLVDAPPALLVGDAIALCEIVDAVFVCVRLRVVTRAMLDRLAQTLSSVHSRPLGFVTTGVAKKDAGYGYGYGYSTVPAQPREDAATS